MTRINLVPVDELMDQHLMAEWREIRHVGPSFKRSLNSKKGFDKKRIPKKFTLNKGHVTFFYDKGLYLEKRFNDLTHELKCRGINISNTIFDNTFFIDGYYNDWVPDEEAYVIIRERIKLRINAKPNWYRKSSYINKV